MIPRWTIAVGLVGLGALGFQLARESAKAPTAPGGAIDVRQLAADAGLPPEWGDFLALVAHNESNGGYPRAVNDRPSEVAASARGYARAADRFEACDHPESAYTWGSGGLFGHLPSTAFSGLKAGRCLDPSRLLEPEVSLAAAVSFGRGLMKWPRFNRQPSWLNLRAMWKWPAKGGDPEYLAERRPHYEEDAAAVGLPASFLDQRPPPLSMSGDDVLEHFGVI